MHLTNSGCSLTQTKPFEMRTHKYSVEMRTHKYHPSDPYTGFLNLPSRWHEIVCLKCWWCTQTQSVWAQMPRRTSLNMILTKAQMHTESHIDMATNSFLWHVAAPWPDFRLPEAATVHDLSGWRPQRDHSAHPDPPNLPLCSRMNTCTNTDSVWYGPPHTRPFMDWTNFGSLLPHKSFITEVRTYIYNVIQLAKSRIILSGGIESSHWGDRQVWLWHLKRDRETGSF